MRQAANSIFSSTGESHQVSDRHETACSAGLWRKRKPLSDSETGTPRTRRYQLAEPSRLGNFVAKNTSHRLYTF